MKQYTSQSIARKQRRGADPFDRVSCVRLFDDLPDSACVRGYVVDMLYDISPATRWRWIAASKLPKPHDGRFNVGELRRVSAARAAP